MKRTAKMDVIAVKLNMLKLKGMKEIVTESLQQAHNEEFGYEDFLLQLIDHELDVRRNSKVERLLKGSNLSLSKTFDTFDNSLIPMNVRRKVNSLSDGSFIDRHENVLVFGQPGTGKTHLLCALAHEQIKKGRKVLFVQCGLLIQRLLKAKKELELERQLKKLSRYDLIVVEGKLKLSLDTAIK